MTNPLADLSPGRKRALRARVGHAFADALTDVDLDRISSMPGAQSLAFRPLAAQTAEAVLPGAVDCVNDEYLSVNFDDRGGVIAVSVRSLGFARTQELAGREACLQSLDGIVSYAFRFDAGGEARFELAGSDRVRAGLARGFDVLVAP